MPIEFIDRASGTKITESVMGDGALRFAYETLLGRTLWPVLFGSKFVSSILGLYYDSHLSKKAISSLASIPGCMADEAEKAVGEYGSFNEFFTRRLKKGARPLGNGFTSPADGRLMLYLNVALNDAFPIKGATRSLREILSPGESMTDDGRFDVAVVRLAPVDYHRFHFPCDCSLVYAKRIPGRYHSVSPIALAKRPDVYAINERLVTSYRAAFGEYWTVDVGAFGVGTIVETYEAESFKKGEERGYFKFGGSTVVIVTPEDALEFDSDLVENSSNGLETRILCGEKIATPKTIGG